MFLFLSKLLPPLVYPLGAAVVLWAAAAVLSCRGRATAARRAVITGIGLILVFSNTAVAEALLGSLEDDFAPAPASSYPAVDAIVVLGGTTGPILPPRVEVEVGDAFDRLLHGMRLLRAGRAPRLVLSGGAIPFLDGSDVPEAEQLATLALEYGIDPAQLLLESRSRNTHENGVHTAQLLRERGWDRVLLVTSASHMRRAVGVFRRQGVAVVAAPTDVQVVDRPFSVTRLLPDAEALLASSRACKEYVGLFVYWLRGWI